MPCTRALGVAYVLAKAARGREGRDLRATSEQVWLGGDHRATRMLCTVICVKTLRAEFEKLITFGAAKTALLTAVIPA